jgi:putative FmdB family regulatory protein
MPTYEFRCPKGHEFEKFYRSISGAPLEVACPACGLVAERQMSGGAGLVFKGSGFYITDYGKDGKKDQAARTDSSSSTGESTAASPDSKSGAEPKSTPAPKASEPAVAAPKPEPRKSKGEEKSSE